MNFRFPSMQGMMSGAKTVFLRFPFVLCAAFAGAAAALILIDISSGPSEKNIFWTHTLFISALGIPLLTGVTMFAEAYRPGSRLFSAMFNTAAVLLLVVYGFFLPDDFSPARNEPFIRYALYFLAAHLFVSFSPWLKPGSDDDFWAFNKTLFLRILLSLLYTLVLFAGLSVAILSLDHLLGFEVRPRRYGQLFVLLLSLFNTWFFLAGVPKPGSLSPQARGYPGGLKVFVQYVLIPLVLLYIIILYLYTGQILLRWEWPNGWVANLVLSFSIAGIFSLLLLHPIRNDEDHGWIRLFSKGYYLALIPLIVLLALSIWVRISEYGMTVNRYFVVVLAAWLAGIVIWFLSGKARQIKIIPVSLCVIALLISFGPWGAFEVSVRSQQHRLEKLLDSNGLLTPEGKASPAAEPLPFEDRRQISSIITYLLDVDGPESLQPFFDENLAAMIREADDANSGHGARLIAEQIGIEYIPDWQIEEFSAEIAGAFHFISDQTGVLSVADYEFYLGDFSISEVSPERQAGHGETSYTISYNSESMLLRIEEPSTGRFIETDVAGYLRTLLNRHPPAGRQPAFSPEELAFRTENEQFRVLICFRSASGTAGENLVLQNASLSLFLSPLQP